MKKIVLICFAQLFIMCGSTKEASTSNDNFQVRDDFKSASENYTTSFLKAKNAVDKNKSVIILTQGFKGEKIVIKQNNKTIYSQYPITNLKKQYADSFSFLNNDDIVISDQYLKEDLVLESKKVSSYKFIYIMKESSNEKSSYKVTLSNTLRPLY